MQQYAAASNGTFVSKSSMPSQKNVAALLRMSILALALLYVYFTQRIAHLERIHREASQGESGGGISAPSDTSSTSHVQQMEHGFASTLLFCLVTICLLWAVGSLWTKRRDETLALRIGVAIFILVGIQFNAYLGHCASSKECASDVYAVARSHGFLHQIRHSNGSLGGGNVRISFQLHDPMDVPVPDKFSGVVGYRCGGKAGLPPSLSGRTVLNFTTTISTDLNIAFIGDSISEQFAQAFDASIIEEGHERNRLALTYRNGANNSNTHNCLSVAAPVRGGGVSAFWRIATLMSTTTRSAKYLCEHRWTTWNEGQAIALVDHRYSDDGGQLDTRYFRLPETPVAGVSDSLPNSVGAFDAAVLRVPHGWMKLGEITRDRIVEAISLANEHLGASTIIVSTLPLNNNVITPADWEGIAKINEMIRDIARSWEQTRPDKVRTVLVQEFNAFTSQILYMNARHLGLTNATSEPDFASRGWEIACAHYFLKRVSADTFWYPSQSMVCAEPLFSKVNKENKEVQDCVRGRISRDGAHWCVESLGPRFAASIACLLGCVYNGKAPAQSPRENDAIRTCEQKCNEQFMSVLPVEKDWIGSQMSLYSNTV